jgi:hypothetical protein
MARFAGHRSGGGAGAGAVYWLVRDQDHKQAA